MGGLLSLVGASYPPSGVHIASAASSVISSFCENCLSTSLVWWLHDRKMVVHMTDGAKELCGMTTNMSNGTNRCLNGASAEKAGLWISALRAVVSLVTYSCNYQCTELLKDFDASGGYYVLSFAIARSSEGHAQKLLELVTMLVCCKTDTSNSSSSNNNTDIRHESDDGMFGDSKFPTNADAFEIVEGADASTRRGISSQASSTSGGQERSSTIRTSIFNQLHLRSADAETERRVSVAARNFGEGVQRIVMSAKMGSQHSGQGGEEWKSRLLTLLGGSDADLARGRGGESPDIDELLNLSTSYDRFVSKCVEHDLTTNLIHCLRLLRVLELQQAHAPVRGSGEEVAHRPLSTAATSKVADLLCLLCKDPSVGEQLRPHFLGLLSLVGASYPPSGVHIASAASAGISSFCENCLSTSLVWWLHDRKMVVHMTDDAKELCGMTTNMSSGTNRCLYGASAEKAGLWISALRAVVSLVTYSCNYQCTELLKDFDASGGYHVLSFAIARSSEGHAQKLL